MKEISELALPITESEYRDLKAISYSLISRYIEEGSHVVDSLDKKIESPSLTFGSLVDALITDKEEFHNKFSIIPDVKKESLEYMQKLVQIFGDQYKVLTDIPMNLLSMELKNMGFYVADKWSDEKRCGDFMLKHQASIYDDLAKDYGKTAVTAEMYSQALECVEALKSKPATQYYFEDNTPFGNAKHYYQLKFAAEIAGVKFKCMVDEIIVDYDKKTIQLVDLKTTGKHADEFPASFIKWHYDIQARLYMCIMKNVVAFDDDFRGFTFEPFKFIVINKDDLVPMVWTSPFTGTDTIDIKGTKNTVTLHNPIELGIKLNNLIDTNSNIPEYIQVEKENSLKEGIMFMLHYNKI